MNTITRVMKPYKGVPTAPLHNDAIASYFDECHARGTHVLATPKIDGIRCIKMNGKALTGQLKPLPNAFVKRCIERDAMDGWDGELIVPGSFQDVVSAFMSVDGNPDFKWMVFDDFCALGDYAGRAAALPPSRGHYERLMPIPVKDVEELNEYLAGMLLAGYEGVCLRRADSPYKCGRSTRTEGYLIAIKPFVDDEAVIVGYEPAYANINPPTLNERGLQERSTAESGMIPMSYLGALIVEHPVFGRFAVGTGFTAEQRQALWTRGALLLGKVVTFKYQQIGTKDKPRQPVFKAFRTGTLS